MELRRPARIRAGRGVEAVAPARRRCWRQGRTNSYATAGEGRGQAARRGGLADGMDGIAAGVRRAVVGMGKRKVVW